AFKNCAHEGRIIAEEHKNMAKSYADLKSQHQNSDRETQHVVESKTTELLKIRKTEFQIKRELRLKQLVEKNEDILWLMSRLEHYEENIHKVEKKDV
uniref:Uncharacterized protein n=1 Tax=Panagrolaimus sp. ES5 TaxID=591445 RepID=A0AC34GJG2_9BILA